MTDLLFDALGVALFGVLPLGLTYLVFRAALHFVVERQQRKLDDVGDRGAAYAAGTLLRVGVIVLLLPALLLAFGLVLGPIGLIADDDEMIRVAWSLALFALPLALIAAVAAGFGLTVWILEATGLTRSRFGRERHIAYDDMTEFHDVNPVLGLRVRSERTSIRVSSQADNFDDFFNRLTRSAPEAVATSDEAQAEAPQFVDGAKTYRVAAWRFVTTIGFLVVLLLFFWIWPWLLVMGERTIGLRWLRRPAIKYDATELFAASVETQIIYVKGQPGFRYPLRLRFTDGETVEIDDFRAKQLGASTMHLGADMRRRYLTTAHRSSADQVRSAAALHRATEHHENGQIGVAVAAYREALAAYPDHDRLASYRLIGDLLRSSGEHEDAVSSYRAHIDFFPNDSRAWEALAVSLAESGRKDLASDATRKAEDLLMSGRSESPAN